MDTSEQIVASMGDLASLTLQRVADLTQIRAAERDAHAKFEAGLRPIVNRLAALARMEPARGKRKRALLPLASISSLEPEDVQQLKVALAPQESLRTSDLFLSEDTAGVSIGSHGSSLGSLMPMLKALPSLESFSGPDLTQEEAHADLIALLENQGVRVVSGEAALGETEDSLSQRGENVTV